VQKREMRRSGQRMIAGANLRQPFPVERADLLKVCPFGLGIWCEDTGNACDLASGQGRGQDACRPGDARVAPPVFLSVSDGRLLTCPRSADSVRKSHLQIIVSDAECDPAMSFEGLGSVIGMCEVDFNTTIKIDVGSLRQRAESPWSEQRRAVGEIEYHPSLAGGNDGFTRHLVYLKAATTGHEPTAILQYKVRHPHFPHETTGDQFYAEDQFESYRRLGTEVACGAFDAAMKAAGSHDMVNLAATLMDTNAPTLEHVDNFTRHAQSLIRLWDKVQKSSDLRPRPCGPSRGR
jgi:hypothetical protein